MRVATAALALGLAGFVVATQAQAQQITITGAGATFPAPVYTKWAEAAKPDLGISVNYQAIGSGGGQNQIMNRTVDFGASDAPMAVEKLRSGNLLQFPTVMGAVVVIVNLPGVQPNQLKLTGPVVSAIYEGQIKRWNDPKLAELNPDTKLPDMAIAPVHRADGSGTTFVFTSYLSDVSPSWKQNVGASTSVSWPVSAGAKGNDGVAATVRNVRGGIGYVEYAYAKQSNMITTAMRNKAGQFVRPDMDAFRAAAGSADWEHAENYAVNLINQPGDRTWPIMSATFIELPKDPKDASRSAAVIKFFDWAYRNGDQIAIDLDYVPIPERVSDSVRKDWQATIKGPDGKPVLNLASQ
ncbi:MAG: phosphate ABC transporter substrate-binding protein PstS [Acetobacteraceae bacterium]